jgi:Holliday junction resolvasome RuvABC ATP-dependent DNA helicase subunit
LLEQVTIHTLTEAEVEVLVAAEELALLDLVAQVELDVKTLLLELTIFGLVAAAAKVGILQEVLAVLEEEVAVPQV